MAYTLQQLIENPSLLKLKRELTGEDLNENHPDNITETRKREAWIQLQGYMIENMSGQIYN